MADRTLRELVYGKGAHVDPVACVEDLSAELAAKRVPGYPHSIWQIVEHMIYWMEYEFQKISGGGPHYPEHAIESWRSEPESSSAETWQATSHRLTDALTRLAELAESDPQTLERVVDDIGPAHAPHQSTVHAMLWQIAAHNSYHAGQIALLRRQLGAWPPRRGGDTW